MGVLFVVSDGNGPGATIDSATGTILTEQQVGTPFTSRSQADRFPDGTFALGNNGAVTGPATIWQWNGGNSFTQIATVGSPAGTTGHWPAFAANGLNMWGVDDSAGHLNTPTFRKFTEAGVVLASSGPITFLLNGVHAIAPANDESVMYYANDESSSSIFKWDLVNNVGLSPLAAVTDAVVGLYAIPGSTDIVAISQSGWNGVTPVVNTVTRYTAAGAVVFSRDFFDLPPAFADTTIEIGRDPSLTSIWVRLPAPPAYDMSVANVYLQIDLLTGATLNGSGIITTVNVDGAPTATCPFIVLQGTTVPPLPSPCVCVLPGPDGGGPVCTAGILGPGV